MTMAPGIVSNEGSSTNMASVDKKLAGKRHEEYQYLDLIQHIFDEGEFRPDR